MANEREHEAGVEAILIPGTRVKVADKVWTIESSEVLQHRRFYRVKESPGSLFLIGSLIVVHDATPAQGPEGDVETIAAYEARALTTKRMIDAYDRTKDQDYSGRLSDRMACMAASLKEARRGWVPASEVEAQRKRDEQEMLGPVTAEEAHEWPRMDRPTNYRSWDEMDNRQKTDALLAFRRARLSKPPADSMSIPVAVKQAAWEAFLSHDRSGGDAGAVYAAILAADAARAADTEAPATGPPLIPIDEWRTVAAAELTRLKEISESLQTLVELARAADRGAE